MNSANRSVSSTTVAYKPRLIQTSQDWLDADAAKIYTISAFAGTVEQLPFLARLAEVKQARRIMWSETPHFAIFHQGATRPYLVLGWWANDNEMFVSVSVQDGSGWIERPDQYSFCVYDLEVMWEERQAYIETMYCAQPDIGAYRKQRRSDWLAD